MATSSKPKKKGKAPAEPAAEAAPGIDMTTPVFSRKATITEYHETPLTRQLSGCRVVLVSPTAPAEMPHGDSRQSNDWTRYGRLIVSFPIVVDDKPDVERLVLPGRLEVAKTYPQKKGETGHWKLGFQTSEQVAGPVVDRLIELKRSSTQVEVSFFGSFEQKTLEGLVQKTDLG